MTVFVGLLRGVNVGGRTKLSMADLRAAAEGCGFEQVRTYVQSGNVVFSAPGRPSAATVASALRQAIAGSTTVDPEVVVRTAAQMAAVVDGNPFADRGATDTQLHVVFLADGAQPAGLRELDLERYAPEEVAVRGHDVYLHLPGGIGRSKLAADLARRGDAVGTARNWRSVTTLARMAAETA
jgi:uncharacterized protein (DUF1697 family)